MPTNMHEGGMQCGVFLQGGGHGNSPIGLG
jgi:hypothetical protein